jgi:hypothetical protein
MLASKLLAQGTIFGKVDDITSEGFLVDKILDKTGMKVRLCYLRAGECALILS